MNSLLKTLLERYHPQNNKDRENAIKEVIQEIALSGLSRSAFFQKAAFYGGSCLRLFYGLNRFSEDLDFVLLQKDDSFSLEPYFPALEKEFASYGLSVQVESKPVDKEIKTAFIKGNTLMLMMSFFPESEEAKQFVSNQKIRVKFELDTDNPAGGESEILYRFLPSPYEVRVFTEPTLFAGKIHAILCREYRNRVKGRDYYDYLFYVAKGSPFSLKYLENKLKNTGKISQETSCTLAMVKEMLKERFQTTDYELAKKDVSNFVRDQDQGSLSLWGPALFLSTIDSLKAC